MRRHINFEVEEGLIILSGDSRRGLWGNSVILRGGRTVHTGGQLPTTASSHTLLSVSLYTALANIHPKVIFGLCKERPGLKKPRLIVRCTDLSFINALNARAETASVHAREQNPIRAGKNFTSLLTSKRHRFDLTYEHAAIDDCRDCLLLGVWVREHVLDQRRVAGIPPALAPSAVSCVV